MAEFAEWVVEKELGVSRASSRVQKGYDLIYDDGRKIQVKYLSNPNSNWRNEHHVKFTSEVDEFALVVFEAHRLVAILILPATSIQDVCLVLKKRHPNQETGLQLTRRNFLTLMERQEEFKRYGVRVLVPSDG